MAGALTIRRLDLVALAPRDHPEPEHLRSRLEDGIRASLASALSEAIDDWAGEGVVRIHRLDVDLTVDAAAPSDQVAAQLARAISSALAQARADSERVFTYADRSHYVAAFLQELAAGRAWQRWWFRSFDGLKALSVSAAIRTAVLADPKSGLAALLAIPRAGLAPVLAALGSADAERLLDGLTVPGAADVGIEETVAALAAARAEPQVAPLQTAAPTAALAIFLDAVRLHPDLACPQQLAELARALVAFDRVLATMSRDAVAEMLRVMEGDGTDAKCLSVGIVHSAGALLTLPPALRHTLIGTARMRRGLVPFGPAAVRHHTPFGGLFVLLPSLDLAGIHAAIGEENAEEEISLVALIGLLALAACAGRHRVAEVVADPVWRDLFGLPPSLGAADIAIRLKSVPRATWLRLHDLGEPLATSRDARFLLPPRVLAPAIAAKTVARLAYATLSRFARRLPGFARSSAPFLWSNILCVSAAVEATDRGLSVVLERPALDVLLSISGIADADIAGPGGVAIRLQRRHA
jgi:hypothetical protein